MSHLLTTAGSLSFLGSWDDWGGGGSALASPGRWAAAGFSAPATAKAARSDIERAAMRRVYRWFIIGLSLSVHTTGQKATIHDDHFPGYEARRIGSQENHRARELLQLPEAVHRSAHQELATAIGAVEKRPVDVGAKNPRGKRIHAHTLCRPLDRQRLRERDHGRLARGIRRHLVEGDERRQRTDVDDGSATPLEHGPPEDLASAQRAGEVRVQDPVPLGLGDLEGRRALGD